MRPIWRPVIVATRDLTTDFARGEERRVHIRIGRASTNGTHERVKECVRRLCVKPLSGLLQHLDQSNSSSHCAPSSWCDGGPLYPVWRAGELPASCWYTPPAASQASGRCPTVRATPRARRGHALIWRWCGSGRVSPRPARDSCGRSRRPRPPGWQRPPRLGLQPRAAGGPAIRR